MSFRQRKFELSRVFELVLDKSVQFTWASIRSSYHLQLIVEISLQFHCKNIISWTFFQIHYLKFRLSDLVFKIPMCGSEKFRQNSKHKHPVGHE